MKYALFVIVLLAFQLKVSGQTTELPTTKLEEFQNKNGSLILKEYVDVAGTRTLNVQVVKMTLLPEKKQTASGILMSWGTTAIGIFQQTGQAYLDADEVDTVIKNIEAMLKMVEAPMPRDYTELQLSTKAGLKLTLFPSKTTWSIALERQGHRQFIYPEDLAKIHESLTTAKSKL